MLANVALKSPYGRKSRSKCVYPGLALEHLAHLAGGVAGLLLRAGLALGGGRRRRRALLAVLLGRLGLGPVRLLVHGGSPRCRFSVVTCVPRLPRVEAHFRATD